MSRLQLAVCLSLAAVLLVWQSPVLVRAQDVPIDDSGSSDTPGDVVVTPTSTATPMGTVVAPTHTPATEATYPTPNGPRTMTQMRTELAGAG